MRRGDAIVYGTNLSEDKEPRIDSELLNFEYLLILT
jgi:hypothetical protein